VRVFDDQFPLRCVHTSSTDLEKFEGFVDKFDPWHQHEDSSCAVGDEYRIKNIIGTKHGGRARRYIVEWDDSVGTLSVLPESELHPDLVSEYNKKLECAKSAMAALPDDASDVGRMTLQLMQKHKVEGELSDWLQGVTAELESVVGDRCEEVSPEVEREVIENELGIKLRMVLEQKKDLRRKGRLVGQGFWEDTDLTGLHVDSPVASFAAVRMLLFMCGCDGDVIASGDISKAFLKADEYPTDSLPRYVRFQLYKGGLVKVWRLKGPLYGSRDSPKLFYLSFVKFMSTVQSLIDQGFWLDSDFHGGKDISHVLDSVHSKYMQGEDEPCVFVNESTGMRVVVFVDDIISRGSLDNTREFYSAVQSKYPMRSWNVLSPDSPLKHLGFTISEEVVDGCLHRYMSQADDVRQFLADHSLSIHSDISCPMPDKKYIGKDNTPLNVEQQAECKSLVGSLSWYAISLRYDIAHTVSRLQSVGNNPTVSTLHSAIRCAAYVGSTSEFRIGGAVTTGPDVIECHSDSDHAGDRVLGPQSHSGVLIRLNGVPLAIHWRSKKQPKTSVSPAAAEIYAASEALRELRWIYMIAVDLHLDLSQPMVLQVDNNQVISFKYGTSTKSRLRGMISNRWNWVKELKDDGEVSVVKVGTKENMADILTKCLSNKEFNRQVNQIQSRKIIIDGRRVDLKFGEVRGQS
jgi:hypothetical protein